MPDMKYTTARATVLVVVGVGGLLGCMLFTQYALLVLFGAMLGLPVFLDADTLPRAAATRLACGCPFGAHERGSHDRATRDCGCPPRQHVAGVHHRPTPVPKHRNSYAGGRPLPQAEPKAPPRATRRCPCGDPKGNHLNGTCYAGGKALRTPSLPKPKPDPLLYLYPQDKAWLAPHQPGGSEWMRPLFPPPPK